jgi:hypothetical protein
MAASVSGVDIISQAPPVPVSCSLCRVDVSSGTLRTKRRKVFGEASKLSEDVLDGLAIQHFH